MKIRIQGNTLRLRLTQSEMKNFDTKGVIEEKTNFGASSLTYSIVKADCKELQAIFSKNKIEIAVPKNLAKVWVTTELVGLDNHNSALDDADLKILIEKDFACLKERVGEDESDKFPHPDKDTHNC